jgi:hypothetical protein
MCQQVWHHYTCGCKTKGEFKQCDRLWNEGRVVKCATLENEAVVSRNYCSRHLPAEDKAMKEYRFNPQGSSHVAFLDPPRQE